MTKWVSIKGELVDFSKPRVMGIVNATPDSFFGGSRANGENQLETIVEKMILSEVDIFDVGGYSTRPGASELSIQEEIDRVLPVISKIKNLAPDKLISIDSFRAEVALLAINNGADIVNDVSGGNLDDRMFETVATLEVPYILTHMRGTPETMVGLTTYSNVVRDVISELQEKLQKLRQLGVKDIIIDPGFGFAKTLDQNFEILQQLDVFKILELPILVGLSRKSFIWKSLGIDANNSLNGTTALNSLALLKGANILRVHDVKEALEARKLICRDGS